MLAEREFALVNCLVVLTDEELPLLHQLAAMNQVLGSAETRAGRVLAFPNILQHCVDLP